MSKTSWRLGVVLTTACLLPTAAFAHPGSGIVVDRLGQIYFVDTGSGLWKIDVHGALTQVRGPQFHWMAIDAGGHLRNVRLPSGPGWEISRVGANPALLVASDFPIAIGSDGSLYYPTHGSAGPLQVMQVRPIGRTTILATLPDTIANRPIRDVNGMAVGPDGSVYYTQSDAIRRISPQGRVSTVVANVTIAGCVSMPGFGANEPYLRGLDVDAGGVIYVAATGCGSLLKITPAGRITTVLQLQSPWSPTAVARFGNDIVVLEYLQTATEDRSAWLPRVRRITPDGKSAIIASVDRR